MKTGCCSWSAVKVEVCVRKRLLVATEVAPSEANRVKMLIAITNGGPLYIVEKLPHDGQLRMDRSEGVVGLRYPSVGAQVSSRRSF